MSSPEEKKAFGQRASWMLEHEKRRRGWSWEHVADALEVSVQMVRTYRRGGSIPKYPALSRLAAFGRVSSAWLHYGEGEQPAGWTAETYPEAVSEPGRPEAESEAARAEFIAGMMALLDRFELRRRR